MSQTEIDWTAVKDWFGYKSSFHDAEIISLDLRRRPEVSKLQIHAFQMTSEVDERGYFKLDKHALITFQLFDIIEQSLTDWNHQNVLMSLEITPQGEAFRLNLEATYGADGYFVARDIRISVEPWSVSKTD